MNLKIKFVITIAFVFTYMWVSAQNFDIKFLRTINSNPSNFKTNYFKAVAQGVTVFNIAAPLGVLTAGILQHDKKLKEDALYMVGGFVVSTIATQSLKIIVKRDRPFVTYNDIVKRDEGGNYSFPSGHTSAAFCTATSLSLLFPKWYVIAPSYLYAATVGYARMYQGVHYPTDVLAGAIVGAGSAWLAYKIQKRMMTKKVNNTKNISISL